jgi:hypothetical protein
MDEWGWEHIEPWRQQRTTLPVGPFLCVLEGPTRGRNWSQTGARAQLRRLAAVAGGASTIWRSRACSYGVRFLHPHPPSCTS